MEMNEMFTDPDAEYLALEVSGAALPPPELYEQIRRDLTAIRQTYPAMAAIHHRPRWELGQLLGQLTAEAMSQFENGEYHGLDALTAEYGPVQITPYARLSMKDLNSVSFRFEQRYNPRYLAPLFAAAEGVKSASPNGIFGGGDNIEISESNYIFSAGWGDCRVGCSYYHYWVFTVVDGAASLVDEYGSPLITGLHTGNDGPTLLGRSTTLTTRVTSESCPASYTWDFGDGTGGEGGSANHTYPAAGNYVASVIANSFGNTDTATTRVTIIPRTGRDHDDH